MLVHIRYGAVVIGLAVGYPLSYFEQFVGSLRATGYDGHIILGVAENVDSSTLEYDQILSLSLSHTHTHTPSSKLLLSGLLSC